MSDLTADLLPQEDPISTGFCLRITEVREFDGLSLSAIFFLVVAILDALAIVAASVLVWIESIEKRAYQLAKRKPVKLVLTEEYLSKLRPIKKPPPPPMQYTTEEDLQSNKNSPKKVAAKIKEERQIMKEDLRTPETPLSSPGPETPIEYTAVDCSKPKTPNKIPTKEIPK